MGYTLVSKSDQGKLGLKWPTVPSGASPSCTRHFPTRQTR